nr:hypothetical protein [Tanacetum cinerariifolium]
MAPLPPRDQRHPWLKYQVEGYTEDIVHSYEQRLEMIFGRSVTQMHVLDFTGLTEGLRQTLAGRLRMIYSCLLDMHGGDYLRSGHREARRMMTWRQFILALGLHTTKEMAEDEFQANWLGSERVILDKGDLRDYWIEISSDRDFLGPDPSNVFIRDHVRRLCHKIISCSIYNRGQAPEKVTDVDLFYLRIMDRGTANISYLLAQCLFRHAEGRKSRARLSWGYFIGRLATHFGLVSDQWLRGLSVVTHELLLINLHELGRLNICKRIGDAWAWAPQPSPPAPKTMPQRIARLKDEVHELRWSIVGLHGDIDRPITDQGRFTTWMVICMTQLMNASSRTYQAFDSTLIGCNKAYPWVWDTTY